MRKYLEYYQFYEKDENDNTICLYCIVTKEEDGTLYLTFERDYNAALKWLRNFAFNNDIYTTEELKNSSKLHLQVSNKKFREELAKKYGYNFDEINNFNEELETSIMIKYNDRINYEEVINPNPVSEDINSNSNDEDINEDIDSNSNDENINEDIDSDSNDENIEEDEIEDFDTEKKSSLIKKLKNIKTKIKGIKKLAVRIGAIATIAFLGITGFKACSKSGQSNDFNVENTEDENNNTQDADMYYYDEEQEPVVDTSENNYSNIPLFQVYLNQSCQTTKDYMNSFKNNLSNFNNLAKNYIDISKNSRLGLDTTNYTAFQMALFGNEFGTYADNVSSYWSFDELYDAYLKTNSQLKQLATVQRKSSGFANTLKTDEQRAFYQKYEDMIIDLNKTTYEQEKIDKAENILSQIKSDFNMESDDYNPEALFKSDSKYIAVMPMVRSVYDRAKNMGYENIPSSSKMKELSKTYKTVAKENILNSLGSISVRESITPSYEMFVDEIAAELKSQDLYVIDDERSIKGTNLYKFMKKLPSKIVEMENIEVQDNSVEESVPVYSTSDDNFEYYDDNTVDSYDTMTLTDEWIDNSEVAAPGIAEEDNTDATPGAAEEDTNADVITPGAAEEDNTNDSALSDQIIESDEGESANNNDASYDDSSNVEMPDNSNDNQIIESEEDIANSMNEAIASGGYAEVPDGWQVDDDYLIDGTNVIDGSVSDITIEHDESGSSDSQAEEQQDSYSENEVVEEVPVYDFTSDDTTTEEQSNIDAYSTDLTPTYDDYNDIDTYQVASSVVDSAIQTDDLTKVMTQEEAINKVIAYNENGVNAIPVFNAENSSWHVEVIDDANVNSVEPMQYNL